MANERTIAVAGGDSVVMVNLGWDSMTGALAVLEPAQARLLARELFAAATASETAGRSFDVEIEIE